MASNSDGLLPCPICGGDAKFAYAPEESPEAEIMCVGVCGLKLGGVYPDSPCADEDTPKWEEMLRVRWNERAGGSGVAARIDAPNHRRLANTRLPESEARLVDRFADAMHERLYANGQQGKSGWEYMTPKQLLRRAEQELGELRRAVEENQDALYVAREAADVGNFCAMLATVYEERAVSAGGGTEDTT